MLLGKPGWQGKKSCALKLVLKRCMGAQNMGASYLSRRASLVAEVLGMAERLRAPDVRAHDAVLLMDRVMSVKDMDKSQVRHPTALWPDPGA